MKKFADRAMGCLLLSPLLAVTLAPMAMPRCTGSQVRAVASGAEDIACLIAHSDESPDQIVKDCPGLTSDPQIIAKILSNAAELKAARLDAGREAGK